MTVSVSTALLKRNIGYAFSGLQPLAGNRENFVRFLYTVILAQFAVIAILLGGLSSEYLSNTYFQAWIAANVPLLGFLLHGEVDALLIGIALGGTVLLVRHRMGTAEQPLADRPEGANPTPLSYMPHRPVKTETVQDQSVPARARPFKKKDTPRESPEDILAELEKHET